MNRLYATIALLVLWFSSAIMIVHAQEPTTVPTTPVVETVAIDVGGSAVDVPADEPFVLWADTTITNDAGQFAQARAAVQTSEGEWVGLTPCDDVIIVCDTFSMRIEDVTQGEQFYLNPEGVP